MVLLIAGIPALIVIFVGWYTKSKWRTRVAALIAAAVGVLTGSPIYATLDVAFVVIGYLLAMNLIIAEQKRLEAYYAQHLEESRFRRNRIANSVRAKLAAEQHGAEQGVDAPHFQEVQAQRERRIAAAKARHAAAQAAATSGELAGGAKAAIKKPDVSP